MSIYEFNILSEHEKYDITFTKAQFVDTVIDGTTKYALYSLSMFWVEVTYNANNNKITGISSFIGGDKLNRYSRLPSKI